MSVPNMNPYLSSRAAERAAREQRIALSQPIRADRIRAVKRIDRRRRIFAYFGSRLTGAFMFLVIVLLAILAGLIVVRLWGAA